MSNRHVKVGETTAEQLRSYFDVWLLDGTSPALAEAGGQPEYNINGGAFNPVGIGVLVGTQYGRYYADLSPGIVTTAGDVIRTRYKSGATLETVGDTFVVVSESDTLPDDDPSIACYGTVQEGDKFWSNSLRGKRWKRSSYENKRVSLIDATKVIDKINFAGSKASTSQVLQFPRANTYTDARRRTVTVATADVNVPDDIKFATYLIADRLLDGWDPDMEADLTTTKTSKIAGTQTDYDRDFLPEHVRAGIPSASAWALIRPYVRDPNEIVMTRL